MTFAIWTLILAVVACAIELGVIMQRGQRLANTLEMQMKGLGQTYLQGLEIVTVSLERLEKRVKVIEDEVS